MAGRTTLRAGDIYFELSHNREAFDMWSICLTSEIFGRKWSVPAGISLVALLLVGSLQQFSGATDTSAPPHFAEGIKIGEVTSESAIVWMRLCATDNCDDQFQLPGVSGETRVLYCVAQNENWHHSAWQRVDPARDFTSQIRLSGLIPSSTYEFRAEAKNAGGTARFSGSFRTAPASTQSANVSFVVTTGHKYATIDDPGRGQRIYPAMLKLEPDFFVHTGDIVYYDNDTAPLATSVPLARLHWHRMYSLPNQREFHRRVASYFIKDDHDTLKNDCWPGQTYGELTFRQGQQIAREQLPVGLLPYRTVRWGKHLQLWLVEGRDYRSANSMPDGPGKTIWGGDQWQWLQEGITNSTATFKVLVSPTPIVGPDRRVGKNDSYANEAFHHEGSRVRQYLSEQKDLFVVCGDRHWQYVSVDPQTGLREYSCGPSTDAHAGGWAKNDRRPEHEYLRVAGGFLSVEVDADAVPPEIIFRHHDVSGAVTHKDLRTASN
jgi:alkaline phosphatase D